MCFKVNQARWDVLIVLDALRYDYFSFLYKKFCRGWLTKVDSCGSASPEWFYENFAYSYHEDIIYVSANPYINGRVCITSLSRGRKKLIRYCAWNHLGKIIDVWKDFTDEKYGVVLPETLTAIAVRFLKDLDQDKRLVIHYMQPHIPFIDINCLCNLGINFNKKINEKIQKIIKKITKEAD